MDELNILVDNFINSLESDKKVSNLKKSYDEIKKDKDLSKKLNTYNDNKYNSVLREELISNDKIMDAHKCEGDVNYIILSINKELSCFKSEKRRCI